MIAAEAKELAGDRAGAERELEAKWLYFRDTLGGAPDQRAMQAAYRLANLYCDDGRWDDAEECLAFYRDVPDPNSRHDGRISPRRRRRGSRRTAASSAKRRRSRSVPSSSPSAPTC